LIPYEKYDVYRQELNAISILLEGDPATVGIVTINKKIAEVNAMRERVAAVLSEAIANVYEREHFYEEMKLDYDIKFQKTLNGDPSIQSLKSDTLRVAAVNAKLPDEFLKMNAAKINFNDAEGFLKLVQAKYNQLDSANSNISRQISVIQLQLEVGEVERMVGIPFQERNISLKRV